MNIGLVDLDTSHPGSWIPILRDLGQTVTGVWDGGSVHPPEYVGTFCDEHGVKTQYPTLEDMANDVDVAIIHGCDWDSHVAKARPFIEAGKGLLIDKPMVGCYRDAQQLLEWSQQGAKICGGSSIRFAPEVPECHAEVANKGGQIQTAFGGCGVDLFNYGIHAWALLAAVMGPGMVSVRHLGQAGETGQSRFQVNWADGRMGILSIGEAIWLPFYITVVATTGIKAIEVDGSRTYRALLEAVLPYLAGDAPNPVPMDELIEPEFAALAANRSQSEGDREVMLNELSEDDTGYDGSSFADSYRLKKYPN